MRLFFAVKISDVIKREVAQFLAPMIDLRSRVKWVEPANMHLTLKFLGETEEERLPDLEQAGLAAAQDAVPFDLTIRDCGAFPNLRAPRVFWIGITDPEKRLRNLQKDLDYILSQAGWEQEKRKFSPHLTVGRVKDRRGLEQVKEAFARAEFAPISLKVEEFYLIRSQLRPTGPIYTDLLRFALSGRGHEDGGN
jgi:2'-5' RNA ligase